MFRLLLATIAILFSSCSESAEEIPPHVLKHETMAKVIAERHLIDAAVNLHIFKDKMETKDIAKLYDLGCKKHGVRPSQFDSSFAYYKNNPAQLDKVYDLVLEEMSQKKAEVAK